MRDREESLIELHCGTLEFIYSTSFIVSPLSYTLQSKKTFRYSCELTSGRIFITYELMIKSFRFPVVRVLNSGSSGGSSGPGSGSGSGSGLGQDTLLKITVPLSTQVYK